MNITIIDLACIVVWVIIIIPVTIVILWHRHQKNLEQLSRYNINVNAIIDQTIPEILELFVTTEFDKYRAKFLIEDKYITDEREKEIINDMTDICATRLSPAMVDKLSLFWRPASIASVIGDQIYLTVVAYRSKVNSTTYDDSQTINGETSDTK